MLATLIAAAQVLSAAAAADLPSLPPEIAIEVTTVDRYPPLEVGFAGGVRGLPHRVYATPAGFRPLELDLYLPPSTLLPPKAGFPLVVYIHGGAWNSGDTHRIRSFVDFPGVLASLSARGYVVAAVEYRLTGEARFPAQAQDVKAAIRWLRGNAVSYGIDGSRVLAWGVSAGGHLAALAALACGAPALEPAPSSQSNTASVPADVGGIAEASDCVQGAVAWYGVYDLATLADHARRAHALSRDAAEAPEWQLLGCFGTRACTPQQIAAASPTTYVDRSDPPLLLIAGAADTAVPPQQTLELADRLNAAGVQHELLVLPGINHNFIGPTPEQTRHANLTALAATFRFIDHTIGNASASKP